MITQCIKYLVCIAAVLALGSAAEAPAENAGSGEYQVKAAFLYNFAKFVKWPDRAFSGPDAPFVIGVLGEDPFGDALDTIKGKTVKGRTVLVKRLDGIRDGKSCHILFISSSESGRVKEILNSLIGSPVLLVGDMERVAQRGGMINFIIDRNKVSFEVNAEAARKAGLTISSQLLKLARTVY